MDAILSDFIEKTDCEPGFARDLLNHHNGNLAQALKSYNQMSESSNEETDQFHAYDSSKLTSDDSGKDTISLQFVLEQSNSVTTPLTNGHSKEEMPQDHREKCNLDEEPSSSPVHNKFPSEPSLVQSAAPTDHCDTSILSTSVKQEDGFLERKLTRGISRAGNNEHLVSRARNEFAQDFQTSCRGSRLLNIDGDLETPEFTFTLPDISIHPEDFCSFLRRDLIEKSTLASLETSKRLNWWSKICQKLYPLVTSGDGNCLLHAASLGMWGFHDRELMLRRAMHILLSNSQYTPAFYRRWRVHMHLQNLKSGLIYSESEWKSEWENVLQIASTEPRCKRYTESSVEKLNKGIKPDAKEPAEKEKKDGFIYESLEEIHIFVLAHVLRRPIIIIADTMLKDLRGEAFFPIPFGGIYLPLECPQNCLMKTPLCLTYDTSHFSALVPMNKDSIDKNSPKRDLPFAIPLMDVDHNILPLHFAIDPGEEIIPDMNSDSATAVAEPIVDQNILKSLAMTEQDKIELLKQYFDIITFTHMKENCVEVKTSNETINNVDSKAAAISKAQTLPINFGSKPSEYALNESKDTSSMTLTRKASKILLEKPLQTFGRMSKRWKKSIGNFARTSFRKKKSSEHKEPESKSSTLEVNLELQVPQDATKELPCSSRTSSMSTNESTKSEPLSIIATDNSTFYCDTNVLAAKLFINKQHLYYDEMIKNYLSTARTRFLKEKRENKLSTIASSDGESSSTTSSSSSSSSSSESLSASNSSTKSQSSQKKPEKPDDGKIRCVNCDKIASSQTNYLCLTCFNEQKSHHERNYSSPKIEIPKPKTPPAQQAPKAAPEKSIDDFGNKYDLVSCSPPLSNSVMTQ